MSTTDPRLPVTVVAGWFESGKTTLIRHLSGTVAGPVAVLQGGFADPGRLDPSDPGHHLALEEEVVELEPGCAQCAVRLDLVDALGALGARRCRPAHAFVELTGDADVASVIQTALGDADLRRLVLVDGIVVVVDAVDTARRVLGGAEPMLPHSLVDQVAVADQLVVTRSEHLAPHAIDAALWTLRELNRAAPIALGGADAPAELVGRRAFGRDAVEARLVAERDQVVPPSRHHVQQLAVTVPGELDGERLDAWIADLHHRHGADLLRLHAVIAVRGEPNRWVASGSRTVLDLDAGAPWPDGERWSRIRIVGRGLDVDQLGASLNDCASA